MEVRIKVDEISKFCSDAGSNKNVVINVAVKEMRNGTGVYLEGVFNATTRNTGMYGTLVNFHSYTFDLKKVRGVK